MNRRGVSPVVATVLLLVLTVVIGGIIFSVVVPFVKNSLQESKTCLAVFEGVEFPESKFNCYKSAGAGFETGFSIKLNKEEISGFRVALIDRNGNSEVKNIPGTFIDVKMVGGSYNTLLEFPTVGGQRSYVINRLYSKAEVSPISKSGDVCAIADVVEFAPCVDVVF